MNKKETHPWECIDNHLPGWIKDNDAGLVIVMGKKDHDMLLGMALRYNDLTNKEEDNEGEDSFSFYGIEDEKTDLMADMIAIYSKYRDEAIAKTNWLREHP